MITKAELMALLDQRDGLDAKIEEAQKALGLDAKNVKEIRKAAAKAAAAKKTLDALMGLNLDAPGQPTAEELTDPEGGGTPND